MRGKASFLCGLRNLDGITPAHAGKRPDLFRSLSRSWDHPRACGEKNCKLIDCNLLRGSPPRMRGKAEGPWNNMAYQRITPAHAGKRRPRCSIGLQNRDHPRACGEKLVEEINYSTVKGSPPRMRGKERDRSWALFQDGITPAHAGKRQRKHQLPGIIRDHPRACGEKRSALQQKQSQMGSPPRMRGKEHRLTYNFIGIGITPAHAGKSHGR